MRLMPHRIGLTGRIVGIDAEAKLVEYIFSGNESRGIEAGTKAKEIQFTHLPRIN